MDDEERIYKTAAALPFSALLKGQGVANPALHLKGLRAAVNAIRSNRRWAASASAKLADPHREREGVRHVRLVPRLLLLQACGASWSRCCVAAIAAPRTALAGERLGTKAKRLR
jgi:hypothetical protein